jgi:hypothetical protein
MPWLEALRGMFGWQSAAIATPQTEITMGTQDFEELAGRIEGLSRAVLHLAAALERANVIDGPQLALTWSRAMSDQCKTTPLRMTARKTLQEMSVALDDARRSRQSAPHQS